MPITQPGSTVSVTPRKLLYAPTIVDGVAVETPGVRDEITFVLERKAAG
jgi:hypothetical protein